MCIRDSAYIVSAIVKPGVVENMGNRQEIYFGIDGKHEPRLKNLEDLFKFAGIEATLSTEISVLIWEKFIFLSSLASATSVSYTHLDVYKRQVY